MAAPPARPRRPSPPGGEHPAPAASRPAPAVDFPFLAEQTCGDGALERELLALFLDQGRRVVPRLAAMAARERGETAHLLKGSSLGIGAFAMAAAAQAVADAPGRPDLVAGLCAAFTDVAAAVAARLAGDAAAP